MRKWIEWKEPLKRNFRSLDGEPLGKIDPNTFFDVELGLRLHEKLIPERSVLDTWTLLTGYSVHGVDDTPTSRHMRAIARHRLRYLHTQTQWQERLHEYAAQPAGLRMYDIDLKSERSTPRLTLPFAPERVRIYDEALNEPAQPENRRINYAPSGEYTFTVKDKAQGTSTYSVVLSEKLVAAAQALLEQHREEWETEGASGRGKQNGSIAKRKPIRVSLITLREVAEELQQKDPGGHWVRRANDLCLTIISNSKLKHDAEEFTIEGLFHLVGMMGSGKSTLIQLLVYYVVTHMGMHVTIMLATVTESLEMASSLRKVGISAAPALGNDRGVHRFKYGQANAEGLNPGKIFVPPASSNTIMYDYENYSEGPNDEYNHESYDGYEHPVDEDEYYQADSFPASSAGHVAATADTLFAEEDVPALRWLSAPCMLSGAVTEGASIPSGYEPCTTLTDLKGTRYTCPLIKICPVHQARQDLLKSDVWVVNPASFIHSRSPDYEGKPDLRMLEAVYRTSDLLVIDEADRVQVQWDRKYAPTDDLVGHKEALIDWLQRVITERMSESGRALMSKPLHKSLSKDSSEVNRLTGWIMYLLLNNPDLVQWIGRRPLTNTSIYYYLARELSNPAGGNDPDAALIDRLFTEFKQFYQHPTSLEEGGELAELVNDVRYEDSGLGAKLVAWLNKRLPEELSTRDDAESLVVKLEFSLLLTVMDKRLDSLLRNWLWVAHDYGERAMLDQSPPDDYINLVPEAPMGNLLGYQYDENPQRNQGGILRYIQCHGLGRWLLLNFHQLYDDLDGTPGPHVLLASATSWSPGSPQFHITAPPNAILSQPKAEREAIEKHSLFRPNSVPDDTGSFIRISGVQGKKREDNIRRLMRYLGAPQGSGPSLLERELQYWQEQGMRRKVLVVVGSYQEARLAAHALIEMPGWRDRVVSLHPDDDDALDTWLLPRADVENLSARKADVLIAPLLAIQRGFNILDDAGAALLGTAFFLTRPIPVPSDLGQHVTGVNSWTVRRLMAAGGRLPPSQDGSLSGAVREMRQSAYREWRRRIEAGQFGIAGMDKDLQQELMWDQFVAVWQTIGRLVRRGRPARVFFVDAAFHPKAGVSMLHQWLQMLREYLGESSNRSEVEKELAETLYGPAYRALSKAIQPPTMLRQDVSATVAG